MNQILSEILSKLSTTNKETITTDILRQYQENKYCIVHFLYFATIVLNALDREDNSSEKKNLFIEALHRGDFLLPDGIALRLLYRRYFKKEIPNLNGTDFLPFFFSNLGQKQPTEVLIYGGTETVAQRAASYIQDTFLFPVISVQHGFQEFNWNILPEKSDNTLRIMLVGRGSPLQELWGEKNREKIKEMKCLVFTVG